MARTRGRQGVRLGVVRCSRAALVASTALTACVTAVALPAAADPAPNAQPSGGRVVAGSATILQSPTTTTINQASQQTTLNWQSFNVGSGQSVQFNQPSSRAIAINQVVGPDPSQIAGRIDANGQLVLINQAGVLFTKGAQVNAAGLVVSAAGITSQALAGGRLVLDQAAQPGAQVVNQGTITVRQAGMAAFVAPVVANSGVINARLGHVVLAGAKRATVDLYGDGLLALDVTSQITQVPTAGGAAAALVTNSGTILADGGSVQLTARAADGIVQNLVQAGGSIRAASVGSATGRIALSAIGGSVVVDGQLAATGSAPGTAGGAVEVLASGDVTVASGARIDVSGRSRGGVAAIGTTLARASGGPAAAAAHVARNVAVQQGATIAADGGGGRVTLLATDTTQMDGSIAARGGAAGGDGGRVEVSGATLGMTGGIDVSAAHGALGTILLDPLFLTIGTVTNGGSFAANDGTIFYSDGNSLDTIAAAVLNSFTGNAVLQAGQTLTVAASVNMLHGSLTLEAGQLLTINAGVSLGALGTIVLAAGGAGPATPPPPSQSDGALISVLGTVASGSGAVVLDAGIAGTIALGANAVIAAGSGQRITFATDALTVAAGAAINAPAGSVEIAPELDANAGVPLVSIAPTNTSSGLVISQSVLNAISTGTLVIGAATTFQAQQAVVAQTVEVGGAVNLGANINGLTLAAQFDVNLAAPVTVPHGSLQLDAAFNVTVATGASVAASGNVTLLTTGGDAPGLISVASTVASSAGNVVLQPGDGGTIALAAGGGLSVTAGHYIELQTDNLSVDSGVTAGAIAAPGGTVEISTAQTFLPIGVLGSADTPELAISASALHAISAGQLYIGLATTSNGLSANTGTVTIAGSVDMAHVAPFLWLAAGSGDVVESAGGAIANVATLSLFAKNFNLTAGGSANSIGSVNDVQEPGNGASGSFSLVVGQSTTLGPFVTATAISVTGLDGASIDVVGRLAGSTATLSGQGVSFASGASVAVPFVTVVSSGGITLNGMAQLGTIVPVGDGFVGGTVDLTAGAGVTEASSATITTTSLASRGGITGTVSLLGSNTIDGLGSVQVTHGNFQLADAVPLTLSGSLTATGNVYLRDTSASGLTLTQTAEITAGSGSTIGLQTDALTLAIPSAVPGATGTTKSAGTLEIAPNTVGATLTIGSSGSTPAGMTGLTAATIRFGAVTQPGASAPTTTAGAIDVLGSFDVGGGALELDATGAITASAAPILGVAMLSGQGSAWSLTAPGNTIAALGAIHASSFDLANATGITVTGRLIASGSVTLDVRGAIGIAGVVSAPAIALGGTEIDILPTGTLSDGGAGTTSLSTASAGTLGGSGNITQQFGSAGTVDQWGLVTAGKLALVTAGATGDASFSGGSRTAVAALGSASVAGSLALSSAGHLTVSGPVAAAAVTLEPGTLDVTGTLAATAAAAAGVLVDVAAGGVTLESGAHVSGSQVNIFANNGITLLGQAFLGGAGAVVGVNGNGHGVSEAATATIVAGTLDGHPIGASNATADVGAVDLAGSANAVATLGDMSATGFTLTDTGALRVSGTLTAATVALSAATITIPGVVLGSNSVNLTARATSGTIGDISLSGVLSTPTLALASTRPANSAAGGAADLSSGATVTALGSVALAGSLDLRVSGSLTVAGAVAATGLTLDMPAAGTLDVTGRITATGATVLLDAGAIVLGTGAAVTGAVVDLTTTSGGVSEAAGAVITAGALRSSGGLDGAVSLLGTANAIGSLDALGVTGTLHLLDATALSVAGTVSASGAIVLQDSKAGIAVAAPGDVATSSDVTLQADAVSLAAGGKVSGADIFIAPNTAGATMLLGSGGSLATLGSLVASKSVVLGALSSFGAPAAGAITLVGSLEAAGRALQLDASGTISGTGGTLLDVANLSGAAPTWLLTDIANTIRQLGAITASRFALADALNLTLAGSLAPTASATLDDGGTLTIAGTLTAPKLSLTAAALVVSGTLNDEGGTTSLIATTGGISETGHLTAGTLSGHAAGAARFGGHARVTDLGSFAAAALTLTDQTGLTVAGTVSVAGAASLTALGALAVDGALTAQSVTLSGTALSLPGAVHAAGTGSLRLIASGGSITESGVLTGGTLTGSASGAAILSGKNRVGTLGNFAAGGNLTLDDTAALTVAGAASAGGVTAPNANNTATLSITAGGPLAIAAAGTLNGGTVALSVAGPITEVLSKTGSVVTANTLTAATTGKGGSILLINNGNQITTLGSLVALNGIVDVMDDPSTLTLTGLHSGTDVFFAVAPGDAIALVSATLSVGAGGIITLVADSLTESNSVLSFGGGTLQLAPASAIPVSLGGTVESGRLTLDATLLAVLSSGTGTPGTFIVGGYTPPATGAAQPVTSPIVTASSITLDGSVDLSGRAGTLDLLSHGAITQTTAGTGTGLTVTAVLASGTGDIRLANAANLIGAAGAITATGGQIVLVDETDLNLVGSQSGTSLFDEVALAGGTLTVGATAPVALSAPGGRISLVADHLGVGEGSTVNAGTGTLEIAPASPISLVLTSLAGITATTLVFGGYTNVPGGQTAPAASAESLDIGTLSNFSGIATTLDLLALGAITQSGGGLTVAHLNAQGNSVTLTNTANSIASVLDITASGGDALLADSQALTVLGTIAAVGQIFVQVSAAGGLTIANGGALAAPTTGIASVQANALAIAAGGAISAGTFEFAPFTGDATMRIGAGSGSVLASLAGVTATAVRLGAVTQPGTTSLLETAATIALVGSFDAGGRTLELDAAGVIDGSGGALLNVATLNGTAASWALTDPDNTVSTLGAIAAGQFSLADALNLTLSGTLAPRTGATLSDRGTLTVAGLLTAPSLALTATVLVLSGTLSDGGGSGDTTRLTASQSITEATTGTLIAGTLSGSAGSAATLQGGNSIAALGSFTAAGLTLSDTRALSVSGPVTAARLSLTAPTLTVTGLLSDGGAGTTSLTATTGGISTSGTLLAGTLSGAAADLAAFGDHATVGTLGDFAASGVELADLSALVIGGGVRASGAVLLTSAGSVTVTGSVTAPTVTLQGTALAIPGAVSDGGSGTTFLTATSGGISETGSLTVGTLSGSATAAAALTGGNSIAALASFAATNLTLTDAAALTVSGPVTAGTLALQASTLSLPGSLSVGGSASLVATIGGIGQASVGALSAAVLSGSAAGAIRLDGSNRIASLGSSSAGGDLTLANGSALAISGSVTSGATLALTTGGALSVGSGGSLSAAGVTLAAGGTIAETGDGAITAATLAASTTGGGDILLGNAANRIAASTGLAAPGGQVLLLTDPATLALSGSFSGNRLFFAVAGGDTIALSGATLAATAGGRITLVADALSVADSRIAAPAGMLAIAPASAIPLSVAGAGAAGTLTLGSALFAALATGSDALATLALGGFVPPEAGSPSVTATAIAFDSSISLSGLAGVLQLQSAGAIIQTAGGLTVPQLQASGTGDIRFAGAANAIGTAGPITASGGQVVLVDRTNLTLVGAQSGTALFDEVTLTGGTLALGGTQAVTLSAPGGRISLVADTFSENIATVVNASGGTLELAPASPIAFTLPGLNGFSAESLALGGFTDVPRGKTAASASAASVTLGAGQDFGLLATTLDLLAFGAISQSGGGLSVAHLSASGGSVALAESGNTIGSIGKITATAGSAALADTQALTVASTISATGQVFVSVAAAGGVTIAPGGALIAGGAAPVSVRADTLSIAAGGSVSGGIFELAPATLGLVMQLGADSTSGLTSLAGVTSTAVRVGAVTAPGATTATVTAGGIVLAGSFDAADRALDLDALGTIDGSGGTLRSVPQLSGTAPTWTLTEPGNAIAALGSISAQGFTLTDALGLTLTRSLPVADVALRAPSLTIAGVVGVAGSGAVSLTATAGNIDVGGSVATHLLSGSAVGTADFGRSTIDQLGRITAAGLTLTNLGDLAVMGPVTVTGGATLSASGAVSVSGGLSASVVSLTGTGITVAGSLSDGGGTTSLASGAGAVVVTGTLVSGTLSGSSGGGFSLGGTEQIARLGSVDVGGTLSLAQAAALTVAGPITAGAVTLASDGQTTVAGAVSASTITISAAGGIGLIGTLSGGRVLVQAPGQGITLGDGSALQAGTGGATLDSATLVQSGTSTLSARSGTASTLDVLVSGRAQFAGLAASGGTLMLNLGNGSASGSVTVAALDVVYTTPGSAALLGSIGGITTGSAAARGTISPRVDLGYTFNGCVIGSASCHLATTTFPTQAEFNAVAVPTRAGVPRVTLLQTSIPLAMVGPPDSEDILQLPVVSQQDY